MENSIGSWPERIRRAAGLRFGGGGILGTRLTGKGFLALACALVLVGCDGSPADQADDFLKNAEKSFGEADYAAALIDLRNALQIDPENAEARRLFGQTLLLVGQVDAAEKELSRAWSLGLQSPEVELLRARARVLNRDFAAVAEEVDPQLDLTSPLAKDLFIARGGSAARARQGGGGP